VKSSGFHVEILGRGRASTPSSTRLREADREKIVLIDGRQLAALMVDLGIGVNTMNAYKMDYFAEE
jgi:restriction endonuclease Mrr